MSVSSSKLSSLSDKIESQVVVKVEKKEKKEEEKKKK